MAPHQFVFGQRGYSRTRSHLLLWSLAWGFLVQGLKLSVGPCPRSLVTVVVVYCSRSVCSEDGKQMTGQRLRGRHSYLTCS